MMKKASIAVVIAAEVAGIIFAPRLVILVNVAGSLIFLAISAYNLIRYRMVR